MLRGAVPHPRTVRSLYCQCAVNLPRFRRCSSRAGDPHRVLGVARGCSDAELKQAFREAAKRWHPDMQGGGGGGEAERMFKRVSWAYEAAVLQRSGTSPQAGGATGATEPRDAWRRQQHSRRQHQWQHQQHSSEWQHRQDQSERVRSEHKRANAFIDRIKGSVLASAVLLCVLFSGTPSSRDDIFSPVRRMLGTQRDPKPAAAVFEMEVDEATNVAPGTQRHTTYPAGWMAKAVEEEAQRYPKGYGSQPAHGAPMGAAGVALAKAAWLSRQSDEKYSTAVEDVMEAQRRAREGQPPQTRPLVTEESKATTPAGLQFGMAE